MLNARSLHAKTNLILIKFLAMKSLTFLVLVLLTNVALAQNVIKGTVLDNTPLPLPGANVVVVGTTTGATTDFDGNFTITTDQTSGKIQITYVGFQTLTVPFNFANSSTVELGDLQLRPDDNALDQVVIVGKGVVDLEADRKTPIAVSTVTREQIQLRAAGNVEFPQIVKNTPSVYVSNESGGFGDSQIFVRGFDQSNTAFLLNGQPINGMEDGKMYWSNWSGLSDIVNAVQVQRGLGSSKLAISSVGGTINMVTKTTDLVEGGFARFLVGNGSYFKGTVGYNTGMSDDGWGFSFLVDYWHAFSKYANGTRGEGQNYFFSVGKKIKNHTFNFLITGAPQWHDQNFSKEMKYYDRYGNKYNNNYGFRDGEYLSMRRNYYHKPVLNLNWDWDINDFSNLSTVIYASFGRGGGTGTYGNGVNHMTNYPNGDQAFQEGAYKASNGLIDWDYVVAQNGNVANGMSSGYDGTLLRASVNNHVWYGGVTNYEYDKIENITINVGADIRFYTGTHFRQLTDLLGLKGRVEEFGGNPNHTVTETFRPDPWASLFNFADEDQRVNYDYSEDINYQGGFGQVEWANDDFSVFVQGSLSNQSYKRYDRGNFAEEKESKTINKTGYNIKGGASWAINDQHVIYVNAGKYSRQPFLDNLFTNYSDETEITGDDVANEEIVGFEAGYRFELNKNLQVNLNAYYTTWENRFLSAGGEYTAPDGTLYDQVSYLFTNIAEVHQGLELEVKWHPTADLTVHGYGTVGKWEYDGKTPVRIRDNTNQTLITTLETNLKETKVGQAPQTTAGLGLDYDIIPHKLKAYVTWNYYTDFYGFVDVEDAAFATLEGDVYQPEKLNSYSLFDLGASYRLNIDGNRFVIAGNIYNLLDHDYISQKDNYGYYLGNGATYNLSVKYMF